MARARRSRSRRRRGHHAMMGGHHNAGAYANPHGKRRRGRRHHARRNPSTAARRSSGASSQQLMRSALAIAGVGTTAAVAAIGTDMLLDQPFAASLTPAVKVGIKLVGGLVLGVGLGMAVPRSYAWAPAGIGLGMFADGVKDVFQLYIQPMMTPAAVTTSQTTTTTTTTTPGGMAMLPAGMPAGYAGYTPAACAVGVR